MRQRCREEIPAFCQYYCRHSLSRLSRLSRPVTKPPLSVLFSCCGLLIMDTFAALALATDPAHPALLNHRPERQSSLSNVDMYKQIFGQSIYQIALVLIFHFTDEKIFHYN